MACRDTSVQSTRHLQDGSLSSHYCTLQGLHWVIDDTHLREPGPRAEGIIDGGEVSYPRPLDVSQSTSPAPLVLYVSPTEGQLSPGEETRVRLTFTPKRAGYSSFSLPVWLAPRVPPPGTRPYLSLNVRVSRLVVACAPLFAAQLLVGIVCDSA